MKHFSTIIFFVLFSAFNNISAQNDSIISSNSIEKESNQKLNLKEVDSINHITKDSNLSIGMPYQGGIIFYILQPNDNGYIENETHGLIASTIDQSKRITWWNGKYISCGTEITGKAPTEIGYGCGKANTNSIIQSQGNNGSYAAKICRDYQGGGYSDWYLPNDIELLKMFDEKTTLQLNDGFYWSSQETTSEEVICVGIIDKVTVNAYNDYKHNTYHIRAIRAF